jgi:hypothetical protein
MGSPKHYLVAVMQNFRSLPGDLRGRESIRLPPTADRVTARDGLASWRARAGPDRSN